MIDGMLVREMTRRCDYDPDQLVRINRWVTECRGGTSRSREEDKVVMQLADLHRESGFLSARVLEYVDPANMGHIEPGALLSLVQSLPAKPFQVLSIHDCWRCLPRYGNDLRRQYNQLLAEVSRSDLLSFLVSQIVKRRITVSKIDPNLHEDILEANYSLS